MSNFNNESGRFRKKKVYFSQVSNVALRDKRLSLKAKGLYSLIQSYITIPDFTLYKSMLYNQCVEKEKAFNSGWDELKNAGYLKMYRIRSIKTNKYIYEYELLDEPDTNSPALINIGIKGQIIEKKHPGNDNNSNPPQKVGGSKRTLFNPDPVQNGVGINNTDLSNIDHNNTNQSINRLEEDKLTENDRLIDISKCKEKDKIKYKTIVSENIEYDALIDKYENTNPGEVNEILDILVETVVSQKEKIKVNGEELPADIVKSQLLKLNQGHIEYVMDCFNKNTTEIKNIKAYLLTSLYNAPVTINTYYSSLVRHDLSKNKGSSDYLVENPF